MPLPTRAAVLSLDFDWLGEPFARVTAKSSINGLSLDFDRLGEPFAAAGTDGGFKAYWARGANVVISAGAQVL